MTNIDRELDRVLRGELVAYGEGWLSEESVDDFDRLSRKRVWIVDPLDGTREFIGGIPEWVISVALVEDGRLVAGGVCNPAREQTFLGSLKGGVTLNGTPIRVTQAASLEGATVLASRFEFSRGQWDRFTGAPFKIVPVGSVAYKLALVSAGQADATFTLVPKHEWDLAAGALLVEAAGGRITDPSGQPLTFNSRNTLRDGAIAASATLFDALVASVAPFVEQNAADSGRTRRDEP